MNDSTWIRAQMCNGNQNYLLKGVDSVSLANYLCDNLNDTQLETLFLFISSQLDLTSVKNKVII